MKKGYWFTFLACQTIGCVLPIFANVHSNVAPLVAGILLTLPGSGLLIALVPSEGGPPVWTDYAILVLVNFLVWYLGWKILSWLRRTAETRRSQA